ncbi:Uncharacterised protein [Mycobacteroides abscessus subsp. abscessus]|nr:Uncharacterised protein [Mycobacteroides abscessus subsp. abscessus]
MKLFYFARDDDASTSAVDADMRSSPFLQQIVHVFKIFNMASLIGGNRDSLDILLDRRIHDLFH